MVCFLTKALSLDAVSTVSGGRHGQKRYAVAPDRTKIKNTPFAAVFVLYRLGYYAVFFPAHFVTFAFSPHSSTAQKRTET